LSLVEAEEPKHEIVIVRRGHGDHDEGHHGGVWKIAFADFMTAMMCFFLVMWLINAANEETKAAVASYFNPVKLIDRNSSRKGLEDIGEGPNAIDSSSEQAEIPSDSGGTAAQSHASSADSPEAQSDEKLFADPYAVLAEIAADTDRRQNVSDKGEGGAQAAGPSSGADGGESYRDPFAPDFWSQQVETGKESDEKPLEVDTEGAEADPIETAHIAVDPVAEPQAPKPEAEDAAEPSAATKAEAKEIEKELTEALGKELLENGVSVTPTKDGVSISVTEEFEFGMFEIGSAVPRRDLVLAMEKIGKVLSGRKGTIVVNGHTDGRPFKSGQYDNWRLSSARAHAAYYMIARSGLDEQRIVEVAGFADRKLKNASDPLAAANRRIEIILETGK